MNSKQKGKSENYYEEWRDIPGYIGLYQASNLGRIKSLPKNGRKEKILKQHINERNGYCYVQLSKCGKVKNVRVHRYIAITFLDKPMDEKSQVNHIDGCKTNNKIDNLEYCSGKQNMRHAYDTGLEIPKGIRTICLDDMKIYETLSDAARSISGGKAQGEMVARVCRGERSHYRGHHFAFLNDYLSGGIPSFSGKNKRKESRSLWR